MKKIFHLIGIVLLCNTIYAQTVITSNPSISTLYISPGNGTVTKKLLSAQVGNPTQRILTADISCFPDGTDIPPANAMAVCTTACAIWAERITSAQAIKIRIKWKALGSTTGAQTTYAGYVPGSLYAPVGYAAYPICLAEKLANTNLNGTNEEFTITLNASLPYYYGTDGNCANTQVDLLSAVLHEIAHGLGFTTSVGTNGTNYGLHYHGGNKMPIDTYMENFDGTTIMSNLTSYTTDFTNFVLGKDVFFKGSNAIAKNYNIPPKIWASNAVPGLTGSIISHFDEKVFDRDMENSLMSPQLVQGEVIHDIGNATLGVLKDIGWDVSYITYNIGLEIGKMNGTTFTNTGLTTNLCEGISNYIFAVKPTQNNGSTATIPNGNVKWNLYAYHTQGKEDILNPTQISGNVNTNTTLTLKSPLSTLPRIWIYNADGTILGELRVTAVGNDGNTYTTALRVSITPKPGTPVLSFFCCDRKQTVFYTTPNATSYQVYKNNTLVYTGANTSYTYTPSRLPSNFYVIASNCAGTAQSLTGNKNCYTDCSGEPDGFWCAFKNDCVPEVSRMGNTVAATEIEATTQEIKAYMKDNNQLYISLPSDLEQDAKYMLNLYSTEGRIIYSNTILDKQIDLSYFMKGMYLLTITNNSGMFVYKNKIIIQ